jgi:DNA-directed RNA polymerase beta subunit
MVKIYLTAVSKTEVGDKFASRYGNKGIISKIKHSLILLCQHANQTE